MDMLKASFIYFIVLLHRLDGRETRKFYAIDRNRKKRERITAIKRMVKRQGREGVPVPEGVDEVKMCRQIPKGVRWPPVRQVKA